MDKTQTSFVHAAADVVLRNMQEGRVRRRGRGAGAGNRRFVTEVF